MSETAAQGSGTAPTTTTAQPGGSESATQSSPDVSQLKSELGQAKEQLQKIREFYTAYPDLVQFARKYAEDSKAVHLVRSYLDGGPSPIQSGEQADSDVDELSGLDDKQRKAVEKLLQKSLQDATAPVKNQLSQMQQHVLNQQIKEWRATYNKQAGWPVDFTQVEGEIAKMLQDSKASDAESAYKVIAAEYYRKNGVEQEKTIKELKTKVSMSRASLPSSMAVRGKGEKKSMADAMAEAMQELGTVER